MSLALPSTPTLGQVTTVGQTKWIYTADGWQNQGVLARLKTIAGNQLGGSGDVVLEASDISDFTTQVDTRISASGKYVKPGSGIPASDLTTLVQTSLAKAEAAPQPKTIVAITGALTLTSELHSGKSLVFNGASATLTIGNDASGLWSDGDSVTVHTTTGSTGNPTLVTPDGKSLTGSTTNPIRAVHKGANAWDLYAENAEQNIVHVGPLLKDIVAAFTGLREGQTLSLYPGALYEPDSNTTNKLSTTKGFKLLGNAATIRPTVAAWTGLYSAINVSNKVYDSGTLASTFTVTGGSNFIELPVSIGFTCQTGDILTLYSDQVKLTAGTYMHGFLTRVILQSGQTVIVDLPAYQTMTIKEVEVHRVKPVTISDLTVDMSLVPPGIDYYSCGIQITGGLGHDIGGVNFIGNDYAQIGVNLPQGHGGVVHNCQFRHFWNAEGITAGGRLGYGVNAGSNNVAIYDNLFYDCKHAIASGPRPYNIGNLRAHYNTIYEDPAKYATSVGGSIDAHAGVFDKPRFTNNVIYCLRQAFNARNGQAYIAQNTVRFLSPTWTGGLVSCGAEIAPFDYVVHDNDIYGALNSFNAVVVRSWNLTDAFTGFSVTKNRVYDMDLANLTIGASCSGLHIDDNQCFYSADVTITSTPVSVTFNSAGAYLTNGSVNRNKLRPRGQSSVSIYFRATSSTIERDVGLTDFEVMNNDTLMTNVTAVTGIGFTSSILTDVEVSGNRVKLGTGVGINFSNCNGERLNVERNRLRGCSIQITASNVTANDDVYTDCNLESNVIVIPTGTTNGIMLSDSNKDLVFIRSGIRNNRVWSGATVRALTVANRVGSTAWSKSTQLDVTGNRFMTLSGVASVDININSTGHKLLFQNNVLGAPVLDNSGTYYGKFIGNTLLSVTKQTWKGGTTVSDTDGLLKAAAAPTTGTWAVGDIVYNSALSNAAGVAIGFVNVAAGAPGTWRSFGVTI